MTSVQQDLVAQDGLELGDGLAQLGHLFFEVGPAQAGQPGQLHVQDVLGLHLGELERRRHQSLSRASARLSDSRIAAMIASIMSRALMSPSTM